MTDKVYPADASMTNVVYAYDSGSNGKGYRTGMTDASGSTTYMYDDRGRPDTLSGTVASTLVSSTLYNQLGQIKQLNLGNGTTTVFKYQGLDAGAPTAYYGRLWQIKTTKGSYTRQDMRYAWDANGNLGQRLNYNTVSGQDESETFEYDFLDRLKSVSGTYSATYDYNSIGNITTMNGASYAYPANHIRPHAVTSVGTTGYTYDANGNMSGRGGISSAGMSKTGSSLCHSMGGPACHSGPPGPSRRCTLWALTASYGADTT
jgi:hypothetical protein